MDITGEETHTELETMLDELDDVQIADEDTPLEEDTEPAQDDLSHHDNGETGEAPPASGDDQPVIATQDGKNTIPYRVLQEERAQRAQAAAELAELRMQLAQAKHREQLLSSQVTGAGLTPSTEAAPLTPETIAALREELPEVAAALEGVMGHTSQLELRYQQMALELEKTRRAQTEAIEQEAQAAFLQTPELVKWRDSDPTRFTFATQVDALLEQDPDWRGRPMKARFDEAARRTKAAFGETLSSPEQLIASATAQAQKTASTQSPPQSPSTVGTSSGQLADELTTLANADIAQLHQLMSGMSDEKLNQLLAQANY